MPLQFELKVMPQVEQTFDPYFPPIPGNPDPKKQEIFRRLLEKKRNQWRCLYEGVKS